MSKRTIRDGDVYTITEEEAGLIELSTVEARSDPPDDDVAGEPWLWTKPGPKPRGYSEDGRYDS